MTILIAMATVKSRIIIQCIKKLKRAIITIEDNNCIKTD